MATLSINPKSLLVLGFGVPFSMQFYAYDGQTLRTNATFTSTGTLPLGLTLSNSGLLSGIPLEVDGIYDFTISASSVNTDDPPTIDTGSITFEDAEVFVGIDPQAINFANLLGQPFSQQFLPNIADITYSVSNGALPPGLTLTNKGLLSGIPTTEGTYSWSINMTSVTYGLDVEQDYITLISRNVFNQGFDYTDYDVLPTPSQPSPPAPQQSPVPDGFSYDLEVSLQFTPGNPSPASVYVPYSQTFEVSAFNQNPDDPTVYPYGGSQLISTPPYTYSLYSAPSTLPPGMTFTGGNTAILSGTTTGAGTYNIQVYAEDFYGFSVVKDFSWVVYPPNISINPISKDLPVGDTGVAYGPVSFAGAGGVAPYEFTLVSNNLPTGITVNISADKRSAVLSGTTGSAGTFKFALQAKDANGYTGTEQYILAISAPKITITPEVLPPTNVFPGDAYNVVLTASGGTAPYTYSLNFGTLPPGFSITGSGATGTISGTTNIAGEFTFYAQATDIYGFVGVSSEYILTVLSPVLNLQPTSIPPAQTGVPYNQGQSFTASGGVAPYTYSLVLGSQLPLGITFSVDRLVGTPERAGTYELTVLAEDANGFQITEDYVLVVPAPSITFFPGNSSETTTLPNTIAGALYSETFTPVGGTAPYTFILSAGTTPVPAGLSFAGNILFGEINVAGTFNFNITVRDTYGFTSRPQNYNVTAVEPTIRIQPTTMPPMYQNIPFSQTLTCVGGATPFTYALTEGDLPPGLDLFTAGVIAGTPLINIPPVPDYEFVITATDKNGFTGSEFYQGTVNPRATITILPDQLEEAYATTPYTQQFTSEADYNYGPYTYRVSGGRLPNGLALSLNGVLSGVPNTVGSYTFVISSTDSIGYRGFKTYTIVVYAPLIIVIEPATLPDAEVKIPYEQTFVSSGGYGPYTYQFLSGRLPVGMQLVGDKLTGTPTLISTYTFTIQSTDSRGFKGTRTYTMSVTPTPLPPAPDFSVQVYLGGTLLKEQTVIGGPGDYRVINTNPFAIQLFEPSPSGVEVTMSVRRSNIWAEITGSQISELT